MSELDAFLTALAGSPWVESARRLATSRARGEIDVRGDAPLKGKLESLIGYPDRMSVTIDTGTLKIRQIVNGASSWIVQNNTVIAANPAVLKTLQNNLFHNLNNLYRFVTDPTNRGRLGLKNEGGRRVLTIDRDGESSEVAFDDELRIREVSFRAGAANGTPAANRIVYEEFRDWDGLAYPAVVAVEKDGKPLSRIVHSEYAGNVGLEPVTFEKPAR